MLRRLRLNLQTVVRIGGIVIAVDPRIIDTRRQAVQADDLAVFRRGALANDGAGAVQQFQVQIAVVVLEVDADAVAPPALAGRLEPEPVLAVGQHGQVAGDQHVGDDPEVRRAGPAGRESVHNGLAVVVFVWVLHGAEAGVEQGVAARGEGQPARVDQIARDYRKVRVGLGDDDLERRGSLGVARVCGQGRIDQFAGAVPQFQVCKQPSAVPLAGNPNDFAFRQIAQVEVVEV